MYYHLLYLEIEILKTFCIILRCYIKCLYYLDLIYKHAERSTITTCVTIVDFTRMLLYPLPQSYNVMKISLINALKKKQQTLGILFSSGYKFV